MIGRQRIMHSTRVSYWLSDNSQVLSIAIRKGIGNLTFIYLSMVAGLGHVVCGVAGGKGPVPLHTLLRQGVRYTQSICARDSKSIEQSMYAPSALLILA